jgi:hypothetical protein
MKPFLILAIAGALPVAAHADPADRVVVAAMTLSEQPNYTWHSVVTDDARTYDIDGKTDQSGFTWIRLPLVKSMAERLGRDAEPQVEAVFHGNTRFVVRTDRGWKTLQELPKRRRDFDDDVAFWPAPPSGRARSGGGSMGGFDPLDPFPPVMVVSRPRDDDDRRPYSNAQFALSHPHEELAVIVSSYAALSVDGEIAMGTLTDLGAQLLLVREGQEQIQPVRAAGAFKLVVKNGSVTRYQLRLEGILVVDRRKVLVHQESSTELTQVGTTRVGLTDDLRRKLAP